MNAAVRIQPFSREQVLAFVQEAGAPLAALRALLEQDSRLLLDARTPLMLTLMVCAFRGAAATEFVAEQDLASRRKQVMDAFVKREFQRARREVRLSKPAVYTEEQARHWLWFLAHNMQRHGQSMFMLEQLQPSWLRTKWEVCFYLLLSRTVMFGTLCSADLVWYWIRLF